MHHGVFRLEGEYWTIGYGGRLIRVRDTLGLRCISRLLREPGQAIAAIDLAAAVRPPQGRAGNEGSTPAGERARINVTRVIKAAQEKIAANHPSLGEHLRAALRTGSSCSYSPLPGARVAWRL